MKSTALTTKSLAIGLGRQRRSTVTGLGGHDADRTITIVIITLILATASRTLDSLGAPPMIDFVHIPIVVYLFFESPSPVRRSHTCVRTCFWLGILLIACVLSWIDWGGEP